MSKGNPLVKQAHFDDQLTEEQAEEYLRCKNNCEYFLENYVKVQHPSRGAVLFKLYAYQRKILKSILNNNRVIAMQPRQSGKSTLVVGILLWVATFHADQIIGIASNKLSGAKEMIARIRFAYENLPMWLKPGVVAYNKFDIEFDNDSKIMAAATTASTFRGRSLTWLYLDEFAFVEPRIAEEFWASILPALSAGGIDAVRALITSTPNGSEGKFAEIWFGAERKENGFVSCRVKNEEVPGRDAKFKKEMLKIMSESKYAQEFDCAFISDKGTLIQSAVLEAIKTREPTRTYKGLDIYNSFLGRSVAMACDVGAGVGRDYSVMQIFDIHTMEQLAEYRDNTSSTTVFGEKIIEVLKYIHREGAREIYYTVEVNQWGSGVLARIQLSEDPILEQVELICEPRKKYPGILTTQKTKSSGCAVLKDLTEAGKLKVFSRDLVTEMKFFVQSGNGFRAETGMNDDLTIGCVLLMNMLGIIASFDEIVWNNIMAIGGMVASSGEAGEGDGNNASVIVV